MKGFKTGHFFISLDYSQNQTTAYVTNLETGEFSIAYVTDADFDVEYERQNALERKAVHDANVEAEIQARIDAAVEAALEEQTP